jgi:transcriptional regulator with XRE-family HTH domain
VSKRKGEKIDNEIGQRIRTFRTMKGISQTKLAEAAGVTFQQIQKYEAGVNRVAPGRLQKISDRLGVAIGRFYPSMDRRKDEDDDGDLHAAIGSFRTAGMARAFAMLRPACQSALRDVAIAAAAWPNLRAKRGKRFAAWVREDDGSDC